MSPAAQVLDLPAFDLRARRGDGSELNLSAEETSDGRRLRVPRGCQATLIENFPSTGSDAYTRKAKLQIILEDEARISHYKIIREGARATHHSYLEVQVQNAASFQSHVFEMSGGSVRNTIQVRLEGKGAECSLNGLYLVTGSERVENQTLIEHLTTNGTSREFYKGILDDESRSIFDGLIVVQKEAQKTDSAQTNKNLLLSPRAQAQSNPELKILANDVKCKHGATIGQIDPNQLFYFRSRGIPQAEARKLLVYAFASELIQVVEIDSLRNVLEKMLFDKFQNHV